MFFKRTAKREALKVEHKVHEHEREAFYINRYVDKHTGEKCLRVTHAKMWNWGIIRTVEDVFEIEVVINNEGQKRSLQHEAEFPQSALATLCEALSAQAYELAVENKTLGDHLHDFYDNMKEDVHLQRQLMAENEPTEYRRRLAQHSFGV